MKYKKLTYKTQAKKPYLFIGSKIRGALGYALKEEVCINPSYKCDGCFASKSCVFFKMYEEQNTTHKYRLDIQLKEQKYKFSLLLFGELMEYEESVHNAVMASLDPLSVKFSSKTKKIKNKKNTPKLLKITLVTPLRIKQKNRFATRNISPIEILVSIQRRYAALADKKYEKKIFNAPSVVAKHFYFQDLTRRSDKQNTKMNMGGLMGEMIIKDIDAEVYKLLKIGEVIGVGKSSVFGLGKIKVEAIDV